MSEWISVEDLMPEKYEYVIIYAEDNVYIASCDEMGLFNDSDGWSFDPTHWMPLPEPPKC